jgi:putative Holliday junction resolvase
VRIAAVDYGRARVGLAVCDALEITSRGLETVSKEGGTGDLVAAVADALRPEGVERLVVGVALREDGSDSERGAEARAFGARLAGALGVPVDFHDEGLTTWEAEEGVRARGGALRDARRRGEVDRAAALSILRSYLAERGDRPPG